MEVAPSNGSGSESKPSGLSAGSENRTPNSRVLSPHVGGNAAMPGPGMAYKQWQYPGYSIQAEMGREGEAAASQPVVYYYPPLQPGALGGGYQQQPYYYCNPTHSQPHALPQLQQASSQYPGPKVYQFPGFQEPQPQQAHVQQAALTSPNTSAGQQQFPLRQFSPSPAPYQMNTASITPLSYLGPQSGYEPTGQLLSSPNAPGSSARRPGTALKQGRRPVKQRDPLDLPQDLRMQSYDVATASGQMTRPRVTTTMWEDEKTLCYQVEANGVSVVRRADNDMINGTKLLNVAKITRGRRDGILKAERIRHVVKIGSMHLKGVWIPFERAHAMAQREKIVDYLYPLFVKDIQSVLKQATSDVLEPLPPPASVIPSQPLNAVLAPQQTQQEEDLANPQPQLSYDLAPAWYGNMSSRSHTSPQPYRNTLSYGQCQSMASSSTTPPSFPAPLQPAFHQPLPAPAYHPDFGPSHRPHDGGSAASNSTSSSNASVQQTLSSDAMLNSRSSSRQETKATDNNAKNNTPGKLLTGIQPPQPIVDGSELDDKAQDSQKQDA